MHATQTPPAAVIFDPAAVRRLQNPDFGLGILRPLRGPSRLDVAYEAGRSATLASDGAPVEPPSDYDDRERAGWDVGVEAALEILADRWAAMEEGLAGYDPMEYAEAGMRSPYAEARD